MTEKSHVTRGDSSHSFGMTVFKHIPIL